MELTKILHFFALIFLVYNLAMLWEESSSVNYRFLNETKTMEDEKTKFVLCLPIAELRAGSRTQLRNYKPANYSESTFKVSDFLRETIPQLNQELRRVNQWQEDVFELEQSYVFNRHACMMITLRHLSMLNRFAEFSYKLFVQLENYRAFFSDFSYSNIRFYNSVTFLKIYKLTILNNRLASANLNKFNCLNACLKKAARKAIYLYEWNDSVPIDLGADKTEARDLQVEKNCCKQCNENSPMLVYFLVVIDTSFENVYATYNKTAETQVQNVYYDTYESYSTTELLLQAVGLITLFINMNINETLPALSKLAFQRYLRTRFFRKIYPKIKLLLLIFSFILVLETALGMYGEYRNNVNYPLETKISNFSLSPTPFALAFCIPVKILLSLSKDFGANIRNMDDRQILSSYSYDEIEKYTKRSNLTEFVNETYLSFGNLKFAWDLKISEEVFFKNSSFHQDLNSHHHDHYGHHEFSRCFKAEVNLVEHRYQSLLSISNFAIVINTLLFNTSSQQEVAIYLLEEKEIFNSETFELKGNYMILSKRSIKSRNSLKYNCSDYSTSKSSSVDECINETFLKRHNSLPAYGVLNKSQFPDYLYTRRYFNTTVDNEIVEACRNKSKPIDCRMTVFRASYNKVQYSPGQRMEVNLYFEMIEYTENEPSWQKLLLSCINLVSIFFPTNARKALLTASFVIVRLVLRLKWYKWYKHVIFIFCFLGFLVHCKGIFENIISNDLSQNAYYRKNTTVFFPDLVLCVNDFDDETVKRKSLDEHTKLTGNYLDKVTPKLNSKIIKLRYLNATDGSYAAFNQFDSPNELFGMKTFLYRDIKCFEITVTVLTSNF